MKAQRFHTAKDMRLADIAAIPAPGPGQLAIRNRFAGICGADPLAPPGSRIIILINLT